MHTKPIRVPANLVAMFREHSEDILQEWMGEQLAADTLRLDLIDEKTLELESREFFSVFSAAMVAEGRTDPDNSPWQPMLSFLDELSRGRDQAGFTPAETAGFVLSLKQPLIVRTLAGSDISQAEGDIRFINEMLDHWAIFTTDMFRRRREATIRRQQEEMEELSTPVVKIWDGILALPLVGTLDTRRSQMVTESLFRRPAAPAETRDET